MHAEKKRHGRAGCGGSLYYPSTSRLRQKDSDIGIRLGYTVRSCLNMYTTKNQNLKARTFVYSGGDYFKKENKIKPKSRKELLVKLRRNENTAHHCSKGKWSSSDGQTVLRNVKTGEGLQLSTPETLSLIPRNKLGMEAHDCNPSTQEADKGPETAPICL